MCSIRCNRCRTVSTRFNKNYGIVNDDGDDGNAEDNDERMWGQWGRGILSTDYKTAK